MSLNTSTKKSVVLFQDLRDLFRALGDDTRQEIILLLADRGTMNVTDITAQVSLSRPAISHHLKVLTNSGLLMIEKRGRERFYRLEVMGKVQKLQELLDLLRTEHAKQRSNSI